MSCKDDAKIEPKARTNNALGMFSNRKRPILDLHQNAVCANKQPETWKPKTVKPIAGAAGQLVDEGFKQKAKRGLASEKGWLTVAVKRARQRGEDRKAFTVDHIQGESLSLMVVQQATLAWP